MADTAWEFSSDNAAATQLMLASTCWSCYCGPVLWNFTADRLKKTIRELLPELPKSGGHKLRLLSRPCNLLGGLQGQADQAFFCLAPKHAELPHAAGIVLNDKNHVLVLLSGPSALRLQLAMRLGTEFKASLHRLELAPWQLSMAAAMGISLLDLGQDREQCCLELGMGEIIKLGFSAEVVEQLAPPVPLTEEGSRTLLLALCKRARDCALHLLYEEMPLHSVRLPSLFSINHEGMVEVHATMPIPQLIQYLLNAAERALFGVPLLEFEEDSGESTRS